MWYFKNMIFNSRGKVCVMESMSLDRMFVSLTPEDMNPGGYVQGTQCFDIHCQPDKLRLKIHAELHYTRAKKYFKVKVEILLVFITQDDK